MELIKNLDVSTQPVLKKKLVASYIAGIRDRTFGENYSTILQYFFPELISAFVLMINILDAQFIAQLQSTSLYATAGVTGTFIHFMIKIAESVAVGAVITCGQNNGTGNFKAVGRAAVNAFWVTVILGATIAIAIFFGAASIYAWYGVPEKMVALGIPYLRLRAVSIFCMFIFFALTGFLRGIKNTRVPMQLFMLGAVSFIFFDYALIFGAWGFPAMQLQGSAIASIIQYAVMVCAGFVYIVRSNAHVTYNLSLREGVDWSLASKMALLSFPVMVDKAVLAVAKMWMCKMIAPMGTCALGAFNVVKDMEQFAFAPAIAFAQVITFLVSNDYRIKNWDGIKSNVKKIIFLSSLMVCTILCIFSLYPAFFIGFFDKKKIFTDFAAQVFPVVSVLVFFDLLQLILAAALRGASDVRTVMWVRLIALSCFFIPVSYVVAQMSFESAALKFILIYGSFYVGNGLMSLIYIKRFRGDSWKGF